MAKPVHVTQESFEDAVLSSEKPVVVDFWAPSCGPCHHLGPVLERLADKYEKELKVAKVNTEEQPDLAAAYEVTAIPHMTVFYKRIVMGSFTGYAGPSQTEKLFEQILQVRGELDGDDDFLAKAKEAAEAHEKRK